MQDDRKAHQITLRSTATKRNTTLTKYMAAYTKKIMSQTLQGFQNTFAKLASEFRK